MYGEINWLDTIGTSPTLMVLIGMSVVTLAVAIERIIYFSRRSGRADETFDRAVREIRRGERGEARRVCQSCKHPLGAVACSIIDSEGLDGEKAEEQMQISLSQQRLLLENNLGVLGTMAGVAPLVGLFGTVWGIMRAFSDMSATESAAPSIVAAGVAEALTTTAAGLMIAVPALMLYNHMVRKINVMLTVAENNARALRLEMEKTPAKHSGADNREKIYGEPDSLVIERVAGELATAGTE